MAVTLGKVSEQVVPWLPGFEWNPRDARFLGAPVDFIVFDGLDEGHVRRVVFVEVKTGESALSARERQVRDAIAGRRVEWRELRVADQAGQVH
jgi:predicted Holliday junction resolvase-like endonuclease